MRGDDEAVMEEGGRGREDEGTGRNNAALLEENWNVPSCRNEEQPDCLKRW